MLIQQHLLVQIADNVYLQVGNSYFYSIAPATGLLPSDNAQMTFIWSGLNTGTFMMHLL